MADVVAAAYSGRHQLRADWPGHRTQPPALAELAIGLRPLKSECGLGVADRAHLLEARGGIEHRRLCVPRGDDLNADRESGTARSKPQRHCRIAREAEDRGRVHDLEGRGRLAIDHDTAEAPVPARDAAAVPAE